MRIRAAGAQYNYEGRAGPLCVILFTGSRSLTMMTSTDAQAAPCHTLAGPYPPPGFSSPRDSTRNGRCRSEVLEARAARRECRLEPALTSESERDSPDLVLQGRTAPSFRLLLRDIGGTAERRVFGSPLAAFLFAERQSDFASAELWEGTRQLCTLRRIGFSRCGFWQIIPAAAVEM